MTVEGSEKLQDCEKNFECIFACLADGGVRFPGCSPIRLWRDRGAEIRPVEPEQGNACAGKVEKIIPTLLRSISLKPFFQKIIEMKKSFLGICFAVFFQSLTAQIIAGRVVDPEGNPLASATIELDRYGNTISNETGYFEFKRLKQGTYLLRITSIGYKPVEENVQTDSTVREWKMERLNIFMQPVEIRAIRADDKAPFTKTNLTKPEIEKQNLGQDLPFLLNQTPSVVINSDAGNGFGYTGIRIRGSDATRINVTLNGIPYNDAESQGTFFVDLPDFASSLSSIQVQRGVGTSSNGAGAFGATINLATNEVLTSPYAELNNSYGSFNSWKHTIKAGTGLLNDHFTLDARFSQLSSDGYIDRASSDLQSLYVSGAWMNAKSSLRLNVFTGKEKTYQAWYGVSEADLKINRTINYAGMERPGAPYDNEVDNYRQDHYQLFFNHQFSKQVSFNTAFFLTNGNGYYEQYKADQNALDYGLQDTTGDLIRQLWLDNHYYGQIFSIQYRKNKDQFTFGGGWTRYEGNHFGEIIWSQTAIPHKYRWYDHNALKTDLNVYAKYQRQLTPYLSLFGDLQLRRVKYNIDGFRDNPTVTINQDWNFFNPKAGISYTKNGYQLYASYSLGQKEPNRDDFEAGQNQLPKAEMLHDFEFGFEKRNSQSQFGAVLYYMTYKDQLVLTGKVNDVGAYTRTNIPNSFRVGLELQGRSRISSWMQAAANLTLSRNRINDFVEFFDDYDTGGQKNINHGSTDIAFSPAITGSAIVSFFPVKNSEIALIGKYVSRQFLDNTSNNNRSLDPYYVQDIRLSYSMKHVNFILQVNNVLDKKYEPNGYSYSYIYGGSLITENFYYPMAGTNYLIGVGLKF